MYLSDWRSVALRHSHSASGSRPIAIAAARGRWSNTSAPNPLSSHQRLNAMSAFSSGDFQRFRHLVGAVPVGVAVFLDDLLPVQTAFRRSAGFFIDQLSDFVVAVGRVVDMLGLPPERSEPLYRNASIVIYSR